MINIEDIELPLYNLYREVKKLDGEMNHSTVDLSSYLTLLRTLKSGYMLTSPEEIYQLCEKIWIKPYHISSLVLNRIKLRKLFNTHMQEVMAASEKISEIPEDLPRQKPSKASKKPPRKTPPPANQNKVTPPSSTDVLMNSQQGEFNVSVTISDNAAAESSQTLPEELNQKFQQKKFIIKGIYLPVSPRKIEQSIRSYRQRHSGHQLMEVDWEETIKTLSRKGHFDKFEYREEKYYSPGWTVLIDNSPSMIAFTSYSEAIAESIAKGDIDELNKIYYFKNYVTTHLYYDDLQEKSIRFEKFVKEPRKNILIISDAGAARGFKDEERIRRTLIFLQGLQKHRIAWMNPMPRSRWEGTSAEIIAQYIDMFDIGEGSMDGLSNIVRLFKSKITGKIQ